MRQLQDFQGIVWVALCLPGPRCSLHYWPPLPERRWWRCSVRASAARPPWPASWCPWPRPTVSISRIRDQPDAAGGAPHSPGRAARHGGARRGAATTGSLLTTSTGGCRPGCQALRIRGRRHRAAAQSVRCSPVGRPGPGRSDCLPRPVAAWPGARPLGIPLEQQDPALFASETRP